MVAEKESAALYITLQGNIKSKPFVSLSQFTRYET